MKPAGIFGQLTTQLTEKEVEAEAPRHAVVQTLRRQIRKLETAGRRDDGQAISTGCGELDALLPDGGLMAGTISQWLTPAAGHGAMVLSLVAARSACAGGGALVVIDPDRCFYPPAALAWGIDPERVIVLRPPAGDSRSLHWAIDQALRCPAVAAVWGPLDQVNERWQRRFQLSAEDSGACGMFVRPARVQGSPGWADVQWLVGREIHKTGREIHKTSELPASSATTPSSPGRGNVAPSFERFVSLRLLRVRGGNAPAHQEITLQIDFTTGKMRKVNHGKQGRSGNHADVRTGQKHSGHLATLLAHPAAGRRRQRA